MSTKDADENVIPGNPFQGMTPTITTDENNWNAMFVWKSTEGIPTLYLDGLIIDDYNEDAEKWRAYQNNALQAAHAVFNHFVRRIPPWQRPYCLMLFRESQ